MVNNQFALVIFDCDRVLVDSEKIVNHIFAETLTAAGLQITHAEVSQSIISMASYMALTWILD